MPSREQVLIDTYSGLNQSGVPLVSYVEGVGYKPEGATDDFGVYWLIPKLSQIFNTDVIFMAKINYSLITFLSFILLSLGLCFLIKEKKNKIYAIIASALLTFIFFIKFDLYVFNLLAISLVPLIIVSVKKYLKNKNVIILLSNIALISLSAWMLNNFRNNSGTAIIILLIFVVLLWIKKAYLLKMAVITLIILISFIPNFFKKEIVNKRDNFIKINAPDKYVNRSNHVIWHSIYIGLGFVSNKYVSEYNDQQAIDKVNEIMPNAVYCSIEYENILKKEFIQILKASPILVLGVITIKAVIIFLINIAILNIQVLRLNKNNILISLPFVIAIGFSMLPGILTVPRLNYILLSIGLTVVFKIFIKNNFFNIQKYCASN